MVSHGLWLSVATARLEHMIEPMGVLGQVAETLTRLAAAPRPVSVAGWVDLVEECQRVVNQVQAVQTIAVAQVSAIEDVVDSHGEVVEQFRGFDHRRLDAPALVSTHLGLTARGAQCRVEHAGALAGRYPQVVAATAEGRVDAYRAGVVVDELADAPDDVAQAVLERVVPHLGAEPGGRLRQRVRRALGQVAAQFLRQKSVRARRDRSLRRWAGDQPGVDTWVASLPVEASGRAWAAVDQYARQLLTAGECENLDQARADAMLTLIGADTRVEYVLQVAVPASLIASSENLTENLTQDRLEGGLAALAQDWLSGSGHPVGQGGLSRVRVELLPCHDNGAYARTPVGGWSVVPGVDGDLRAGRVSRHRSIAPEVDAYRPTEAMTTTVKARDGRCRFPDCTVTARFCDLDHVTPWPAGPTAVANLACLCRRHHRVKQRPGWQVRIRPDASMEWTDPTGRTRTTSPVDHLRPDPTWWLTPATEPSMKGQSAALPAAGTAPGAAPSPLEDHHDHRLDHAHRHSPHRRRLTRDDGSPVGTLVHPGTHCSYQLTTEYHHDAPSRARPGPDDPPPF